MIKLVVSKLMILGEFYFTKKLRCKKKRYKVRYITEYIFYLEELHGSNENSNTSEKD